MQIDPQSVPPRDAAPILVALSGGVDSAVAALLLHRAGYQIEGAYIRTWLNEETPFADCPAQQDIEDATAVAAHLGIPFRIVNLVNDYRERVVNYLVEGYRRGFTPNPDTMCNREMKFGLFQEYAMREGFAAMATGHYVRKRMHADGSCSLHEGLDANKDQSYFLALLRQSQLANAWFPLGDFNKPVVRELAEEAQLPNAGKKDSQGICFLGDMNINRFLEHYIEDNPGPIVASDGRVLGEHRGLHRYTLGQRRGIGLPSNTDNRFYVVTGIDPASNTLTVAFEAPDAPGLYASDFEVEGLTCVREPLPQRATLLARPRYRDPAMAIDIERIDEDRARVHFHTPQRAIAPGQVIAFYNGDELLGGGFYSNTQPSST
jgi:tRNA-specific 2-thiouridylase